jgi:3-carboxy-cis,cis-muconate cycloisomerase
VSDGGLFDAVLARGNARHSVADEAWLQAMLDVEAALARACAEAGVIPGAHAEAIVGACRAELFDVAAIGAEAANVGNPAEPLVRALRARVGGAAAEDVHRGATSQDVIDSAAMLVAQRALTAIVPDLDGAARAAAHMAAEYRGTPMIGRTLMQQAVPTSFGLKAAGWFVALDESEERLLQVRLVAQLGGAAGTLAALGDAWPAVLGRFARELELDEPVLPWHTDRTRIAELAGALGEACGAVAKVAGDVILLAQTEVGEVREGVEGRGGSSTMAHKRNPVAAISARAAARQAPGLVATLLASMEQEHERAAGAWHAEWPALRALLRFAGSAAAWLRDCLENLEVDVERMRANLGDADASVVAASELVDRALLARGPGGGSRPMMHVDLAFTIEGPDDAPAVVLSNSLGSTPAMWDPLIPVLAERFRVVRYDHRGHGRSPVPEGPYDIDDLSADVLALLNRLELERVHWCGLSLGGMVGMWMAISAPERIDRLVLCCTSARLGPPEMWADRAATVRAHGVDAIADAGIERWLSPGFIEREPEIAAGVRAMLVSTPAEGYAECCGAIERMDQVPMLHLIGAPTLVIAAEDDPATPPEHGALIASTVPGAQLAVVKDARHMATIEQPAAMTELILGHLLA